MSGFLATLAGVLSVWLVLPLAARDADLPANRWIHEGLTRKLSIAQGRHGKVVLLGGSSVHFGLSARRLEERHGIAAVNIGQHAGLGLRYILDYGRRAVFPGDTVVLSLEYGLWEAERVQGVRNTYLLAHDVAYVYALPPLSLVRFLAGVRPGEWAQLIRAPRSGAPAPPVGGYQASSIDAFGDETANAVAPDPAVVERLMTEPVSRHLQLDPATVDQVRRFADDLRRAHIGFVIAHPYQLRRHFDVARNGPFYRRLADRLASAGLRQAGDPEAAVFDRPCVYDSPYHPVRQCAEQHSDRLAAALREHAALSPVP